MQLGPQNPYFGPRKLNLDCDVVNDVSEDECCKGNLEDKDEGLELIDDCFVEASNLSEAERLSLYYICGYATFKGSISVDKIVLFSGE